MVFDWDDFHEGNHNLKLLNKLREINPAFKCTLFAVPARGSSAFWSSMPDWIELAVHGWLHPHPREAEDWDYNTTNRLLRRVNRRFVSGFKAPGWQISDETYRWLLKHDWWVADQDYNDNRRPPELNVYKVGSNWHGHIQDVCGNGLQETWDEVVELVKTTKEFQWASEQTSSSRP